MACERCWIPHPTEVWGVAVPVGKVPTKAFQLVEITDEATTEALTTVTLSEKEMQKVAPVTDARALAGIDNVCDLADVSEASILHTVRVRFSRDQIYTNVGRVVLALNPFIYLPMYTVEQVQEYYKAPHAYSLRPHLFQVSAAAVKGLSERNKPQSTLITGESGAGKTESTKLILQFLADVSEGCRSRDAGPSGHRRGSSVVISGKGKSNELSGGQESGGGAVTSLTQRILEVSPVLESFGNASTSRNPNSSRFGKWIEVFFSDVSAEILGARITSYLLELPRVTRHVLGERNYHVFYQLVRGVVSSDLVGVAASFKLNSDTSTFEILTPRTPSVSPGKKSQQGRQETATARKQVDDLEGFAELKRALWALNFEPSAQNEIFSIIAALLHIGNVQFSPAAGPDNSEGCKLANEASAEHLRTASRLLGIESSLTEKLFISRTMKLGPETISITLKPEQAEGARDSFSKLVYGLLFGWLIERINANLSPATGGRPAQSTRFIGILDIAGFESFQVNGFEQLCINLSNEELQHQFNEDIFLTELKDYEEEGVKGLEISYEDNADILELVAGKGGILSMLDEELFVPKGSEQGFMNKLNKAHASNRRFIYNKIQGSLSFGIQHYAGPVTYTADGWLVKNQNAPPAEAIACLVSASSAVVKSLGESVCSEDSAGTKKTPAGGTAGAVKASGSQSKKTVGGTFKRELGALTAKIKSTDTHYVRCVKPNTRHEPKAFNSDLAFRQLVCSGVLEAVRIRQSGFSLRIPHGDFVKRYSVIAGTRMAASLKRESSSKQAAEKLVTHLVETKGVSQNACVIGNTRVLAKARVQDALDQAREVALADPAIRIQAGYRGYRTRKQCQVLFKLYEKVKPLLSAGEEAAKQGGFLGGSRPIFADAATATALQNKASYYEELLAQLQSLDVNIQPAILPNLAKIQAKMAGEATIVLEIENLLQLLQPCAETPTQQQNKLPENLDGAALSLAEAVQKALGKHLTCAVLAVASARLERIESERRLSSQLEAALQSQAKATLKALTDEARTLAKTPPPVVAGDRTFAAGLFFIPYLPTLLAAADAVLQEDASAAGRLAAERAAAEEQLQDAAQRRRQETLVRNTVVERRRSQRESFLRVAVGDPFVSKQTMQRLASGQASEAKAAVRDGVRRIPLQHGAAADLYSASTSYSDWTDSSDEDNYEGERPSRRPSSIIYEAGDQRGAPVLVPGSERAMESRYVRKFAKELARATAECDVAQIQFLVDRAQEAGLGIERTSHRDILREQRVAQQQLQNLRDPVWLSTELREAVVSLTWGAPAQEQLVRLQNLVNQATALNNQIDGDGETNKFEQAHSDDTFGRRSNLNEIVDPESLKAAVALVDSLRGPWRYAGGGARELAAAGAPSDHEGLLSEEGSTGTRQTVYELESFPLLRINKLIEQTSSGRKLERLLARRTELLSHQAEPLQESLLLLEDPVAAGVALNCFRDLLGAVGDRFCVGRSSLGEEIVQLGTRPSTPSEMRDEIYCQILKQLRGNPSVTGMLSCLRLLQSCCQTFPPSMAFEPFLRHALLQQQTLAAAAAARLVGGKGRFAAAADPTSLLQLQQELEMLARQALTDLDTTCHSRRSGTAVVSPSSAAAAKEGLPSAQQGVGSFPIQIRLSDGSRRRVFLGFEDPHSLVQRILKEFDLVFANDWGLMEEVPNEELKSMRSSTNFAGQSSGAVAHAKAASISPPTDGAPSQEVEFEYLRLLPAKVPVREYLETKPLHQIKLFLRRTVFRLEEPLSVHPTNARLIYRQALQQFIEFLYVNEDVQLVAAISAHVLHVDTLVKGTGVTSASSKRLTWNDISWSIPKLLRSRCTENEWCRLVEESLTAFDFADGELVAMTAAFQLMKRLSIFCGYFWRASHFPLVAEQLPQAAAEFLVKAVKKVQVSGISTGVHKAESSGTLATSLQDFLGKGGNSAERPAGDQATLPHVGDDGANATSRSMPPSSYIEGGSPSWLQRLLCRPAQGARSGGGFKESKLGGRPLLLSKRKKRQEQRIQGDVLSFSFRGSVWLAVDVRGIHIFAAQSGVAHSPEGDADKSGHLPHSSATTTTAAAKAVSRAAATSPFEDPQSVGRGGASSAIATDAGDSYADGDGLGLRETEYIRKRCRSSFLGEDSVPLTAAKNKTLQTISPDELWLVTSLPTSDKPRFPDLVVIGSFLAGHRPHLQAFLTQVPAQDVVGLMLLFFPHCSL